MGAGEVHGGVMNAANILKPALARGEVQIMGATTLEEYRKAHRKGFCPGAEVSAGIDR